ncbi:unnamed protein product [Ectocarpus sp. CCAP 1310/34]|nr:unnamed protein product [Ectocarpus sp. CCAP 1310/34]
MRSPGCVALGAWVGLLGCRGTQAFLGAASPATTTSTRSTAYQSSCGHAPHDNQLSTWGRSRALRMTGDDESKPAVAGPMPEMEQKVPSVTEMMDKAAEADFVARASASSSSGGVMGPSKPPEEYKRKEREAFELNKKPETNRWASGAFKRGLALQAVVLSFVIFLSFQPEEVGNLAVCAPFTRPGGCVSFGEWVQVVFFGAPIPPM